MCSRLVGDEGLRHELHSPNEAKPKTDRVGANCCCQSIDSSACTIDLEVSLLCCIPLEYVQTMTNLNSKILEGRYYVKDDTVE